MTGSTYAGKIRMASIVDTFAPGKSRLMCHNWRRKVS